MSNPFEDDQEFFHPSYGMAGFSRGSVGGEGCHVFGSGVKTNQIVTLRVRQASRRHHLNQDWYHGGREICEVQMTELQFAELITSMNQGFGVPCSIRAVNGLDYAPGEYIKPPVNPDPSEIRLVHEAFKASAKDTTKSLNAAIGSINEVVGKSKLSAKDKKAVEDAVAHFKMVVESNLPFLMSQLAESAGRVVAAAKAEVMAFTERTLRATGLSHMKAEAPTLIEVDEEKK